MKHTPSTFFSQNPWSWKELVYLMLLTFLFVPVFIENLLMHRLTQWFQNDLYSGTLTGLMMAILFTTGVYLIALRPKGVSWKAIGWQKFRASYWGWILLWYVFIFIGAVIISYLVEIWFGMGTENSKTESLVSRLSAFNMLIAFLSAAVISPIYEEIFYRGFLYRWTRSQYGVIAGMIVSTLIFTLAHLPTYNQLPYAFFTGFVFAWTYEKTASIFPAIFLHGLFNGTVFLLTVLGY